MKQTLLSLTLTGLLTLPAVLPSAAWAAPVRSLQKEQNYDQYISKRQVVDQLLADAWQIFKSPARISTAGFTAKMPSNMEQVTELLLQAYQLEPYRTDLLISAANAQLYNGNVDKAIGLFEQALSTAPDDIDLLSYLATWQTFKHNEAAAKGYQSKLATLNPGRPPICSASSIRSSASSPPRSRSRGSAHPSRATGPSSPWVMPSIPTVPCTTSCWAGWKPPGRWPRPTRRPSSS